MYTDLAHGVPPLFSHFVTNLPAIHATVVFVCVRSLPVNTVPPDERFLIRRIGPRAYSMFRCAARYGYKDIHKKDDDFERLLILSLTRFLELEAQAHSGRESLAASWTPDHQDSVKSPPPQPSDSRNRQMLRLHVGDQQSSIGTYTSSANSATQSVDGAPPNQIQAGSHCSSESQDEVAFLTACRDAGVVYILGNNVVKARKDAGFLKKLAINYVYTFLRRLSRDSRVVLNIPHECLLQVGMVYYV
jgi:KUP system potassium uptake protein